MEQVTAKETYKFEYSKSYSDGEQFTDVKIFTVNTDENTWDEVLTKFALWLGSIYGYDLTNQIQVHGENLSGYDHLKYLEGQFSNAQAAQDCPGCAY